MAPKITIDEEAVASSTKRMAMAGGAKKGALIGLAVGMGLLAVTMMIGLPLLGTLPGMVIGTLGLAANGVGATLVQGLMIAGATVGVSTLAGTLFGAALGGAHADTDKAVSEAQASAERRAERSMERDRKYHSTMLSRQKQELEYVKQAQALGLNPNASLPGREDAMGMGM